MADSPVTITRRAETVQGQAQSGPREPHDGKHFIEEVVAITDRIITDVKDELAVQIPEGVGADHSGHRSPLGQALARGHVEDQFDTDQSDADKSAKADAKTATK